MSSTRQPAAILFDLDGTLVDTLPDLLGAMNSLLAELGRRRAAVAELRTWVGDGAAALVDRAVAATGGLLPDMPAVLQRFLALYASRVAAESRPFPGVEATLLRLSAAGHPLGVCTNKPTRLSVELLTALGLASLFAAVVGGDTVAQRKPAAFHVHATLQAMRAEGGKALMVGDSGNDVAAARAAAIPVVAVTYGYSRVAPEALGADLLIDDFTQLPVAAAAFL